MDNDSLKLFLHLTETLHFGKTSQACHISPSALSRQIQRMENTLGRALFQRDNRTVKLTREGMIFKTYANAVLEKWQLMLEAMEEEQDVLKGELSIYCSVTASLGILPKLLENFRNTHPLVHIRLHTGDAGMAIQKVSLGDFDIAVAPLSDPLPKNLEFKSLTEMPLVFIAPKIPWIFSSHLKQPISWHKIPMVFAEQGLSRKKVDAWFKKKKIQPNIYAVVSGHEAILSMVSLGCGVGVVPKLVLEKSPAKDSVIIIDAKPKIPPYPVGVCIQKKRHKSRIVQAFWEGCGL